MLWQTKTHRWNTFKSILLAFWGTFLRDTYWKLSIMLCFIYMDMKYYCSNKVTSTRTVSHKALQNYFILQLLWANDWYIHILQFINSLYKTISMKASQICINDVILLCLMESPSHLFNKTEKLRTYSCTNYFLHIFKGIYCLEIGWLKIKAWARS